MQQDFPWPALSGRARARRAGLPQYLGVTEIIHPPRGWPQPAATCAVAFNRFLFAPLNIYELCLKPTFDKADLLEQPVALCCYSPNRTCGC